MSEAKINDLKLYYEVKGEGEPLLMIQGLGYSSRFWFKQTPTLSEHFKLIVFDNRDVGRSEKVEEKYSIGDMAKDTISLLDHLEIEKTHVIGVSMGGLIAQQLTINNPNRVKKLILLDTHPGGPEYLEATEDLWEEVTDVEGLSLEEIYRKGIRYAVTDSFFENRKDMVKKLVNMRKERPQPPQAFQRQFSAASQFDVRKKLSEIKRPTLIIHGEEDQIVPLRFGKELKEKIPDSKIRTIENAGHLAFIEKPEAVNESIINFLE